MDYADLEVRILKKDANGYPVEITFNGEQEFPRGVLSPDLPVLTAGAASGQDGVRMFQWLFSDDALKTAWANARGQKPQRRIRLRIDEGAPELHRIPWELLRDIGEGGVALDLAAAEATPFSRYIAGAWIPGSPILKRPIRILVAVANPSNLAEFGLAAIDPDAELKLLQDALAGTSKIELVKLEGPCTLEAIDAALRKGIHILHFVGHGKYADETSVLFLCDAQGKVLRAKDTDIAEMFGRQLVDGGAQADDKLRLVYLSSCQTATRPPTEAFRGLAPRLVAAGLPAVLAMQDLVPIKTATEFSRSFYGELIEHGQVDRASNAARASVMTARLPGAAIPVLFMRLRSGQLLGNRGMILGDVSDAYWRTLVSKIRRGQCTPILGPGIASELLPTPEELARAISSGRYPFADTADLRRVSQFLGTIDNDDMRQRVLNHLTASLRRHLGSSNGTAKIENLSDLQLDQWNHLSQTFETEIHQQLASLGLPLYLTTNFDNFLTRALEAKLGGNGKVRREAVVWRIPREERAILSPPPSADNPVVLHLFGTDQDPTDCEHARLASLVLTEDDHLDYLARISHDQEIFLPASVNALLAKNTLLFLGYRLEDLDLKVILRGLLTYLALAKYDRMQLAVQIETETQDASIQREVTDYFQQSFRQYFSSKSDVKIYWGSAHQFMADLMVHMQESPNG
jgi:hypothetical protein